MTSPLHADFWSERLRRTLHSYDESLLRQVASKLCKPRSHWPAPELIDRCLATYTNAAGLDRRLRDLDEPGRLVLALIAHSRQNYWPVGNLIEMLATLGHGDGLPVIQSLLDSGLLYPQLFEASADGATAPRTSKNRLKRFDHWLSQSAPPVVFTHPAVAERALAAPASLPKCPDPVVLEKAVAREADGLEWPLRLAVLWQQVHGAPLRRTQQGDFFKRDNDRLTTDPLLGESPADSLGQLPDQGLFTAALALALGLVEEQDGEIRAGRFPDVWSEGLPATLAALWSVLPRLQSWNPALGWQASATPGNPYPSAYLVALLLLARLPERAWARPEGIERWIVERHPFWAQEQLDLKNGKLRPRGNGPRGNAKSGRDASEPSRGIATFLLGVAYPLRLIQAAKNPAGEHVVRLSPLGQWVLGLAESSGTLPTFPQTLLVQPNLEVLAYRQGLTPELIVALTRFATWKGLGAACTLQLEPHSVYRALEAGDSFVTIVQTLERYGMKPVPTSVLDSLRTWSNKRERISVYPAAALFEFPGPAELAEALARGLPAVRLTDRLAIVPNEAAIDYRHFRLTGTRDYCLPPEKCVDLEGDGVTLSIDLARSDLLLETEVQGLAEPAPSPALPGRRLYRLTPASLAAARAAGWTLAGVETWFSQRTGLPLSSAAHLLFTAPETPPLDLRRRLVLHVASSALADGLQQWPQTRELVEARLGPTALAVAEKDLETLLKRCKELGLTLLYGEG